MHAPEKNAMREIIWIPERRGYVSEVRSLLADGGYRLIEAPTAVEGLRLLDERRAQSEAVACLLTGIHLPDIPGLRMLEMVKSRFPRLPVVVLTEAGTPPFPGDRAARLADGFFQWPCSGKEVTDHLGRLAAVDPFQAERRSRRRGKRPHRAWGLIQLFEEVDAERVFRALRDHPLVQTCDGVQGEFDLVVSLASGVAKNIEQFWKDVSRWPEVARSDLLAVIEPPLDEAVQEFLAAFRRHQAEEIQQGRQIRPALLVDEILLVEIDPAARSHVFPRLACAEGVVQCEAVRGPWQAIVQVQGPTREQIRRLVSEELASLEGVLRLRPLKVVRLSEN
ncbi:MAG: hypothetical protein OZSIB_3225 [Candidatus Ozemobacter sibiricus]|jgi:CheY-like chemotaxis protein|uniref:Response regulatory domain-containing protein n=1 Tax=Candidatus Ozemobacter sibiricus TaxID=2268124 RepID=A0A367ZRV7_9BACT|nr:MAG: hypothetical protein OZSIB_3225 [Candidatus Ozemobacter sibiricus]